MFLCLRSYIYRNSIEVLLVLKIRSVVIIVTIKGLPTTQKSI